jgi:hypothetical protein
MDDLLSDVIEAHGGLDLWRSFSLGEATIVTGGGLWGIKGLIQDPNPRRMTVSLHEERASLKPFGDPDWHTEFTPERIAIVRSDGSVVKERTNPRASFAGHSLDTPWGAVTGTAAETQFDRGPVSLMPERSHAAIAPPLRSGKHAVSDGRRDGAGD